MSMAEMSAAKVLGFEARPPRTRAGREKSSASSESAPSKSATSSGDMSTSSAMPVSTGPGVGASALAAAPTV